LRRCLEKDPKRRRRDIGDWRVELEDALKRLGTEDQTAQRTSGVTRRTAIGTLLGATAGAAATGIFAVNRYRNDATPRNLVRFAIALPERHFCNASFNKRVVISPDGAYLACNAVVQGAQPSLLIRSMRDLELKAPAEGAYGTPFFSSDGRWLAYFAQEPSWRLRKIALSGGAPVTVCSFEFQGGGTWVADDVIYFISATPGALMRVPAAGGEPVEALNVDFDQGERLYKFPWALPGGDVLLTVGTIETESFDDAQIAVFSPRTGAKRILVEGGSSPCYSPSGHLVYARDGRLLAVSFNPDRLEVTGQPFTVLEGVLMSRNTGTANFDISAAGDLVYVPGKAVGGARTLHWVDRSGRAEQLPLPPRSYLHPRLSPDATRLAIEIEGSDHDVYVYDFRNGVLSNITTDGVSHWPVWSPDGQRIGYRSGPMGRFQLFQVPADRSRSAEPVAAAPDVSQSPGSYSPDGRALVYTMNLMTASAPKIAVVRLEGDRTPRPLDDTRYSQGSPKFSPDGRFLAYCSNESGRPQVYVQAFPGPGPKAQVSSDGGTDPVWRRNGGELFYRNGNSMMAVPVATTPAFSSGRPQEMWKGSYSHGMSSSCGAPGLSSSNYDVTADGQRFLMIRDDDIESETSREIVLVQGWADEVRRLAART
jgi:serine/threonine-protein kinase